MQTTKLQYRQEKANSKVENHRDDLAKARLWLKIYRHLTIFLYMAINLNNQELGNNQEDWKRNRNILSIIMVEIIFNEYNFDFIGEKDWKREKNWKSFDDRLGIIKVSIQWIYIIIFVIYQ